MDNATVSSLYCIPLYDNYIALNDKFKSEEILARTVKMGKQK
jgi:hypothetical protein